MAILQTVWLVCVQSTAPNYVDRPGPDQEIVIHSIAVEALAAALDAQIDPQYGGISERRREFLLHFDAAPDVSMDLGVFPSVAEAQRAFDWHSRMPQVLGNPQTNLGDDSLAWDGKSVLFRKLNVVCCITSVGRQPRDIRPLARTIDGLFSTPSAVTGYGSVESMPRIEEVRNPVRLARPRDRDDASRPERWPRFSLAFKNLDDADDLRVLVQGQGVANWTLQGRPQTDLPIPRSERPRGTPGTRPPRPGEDGRYMLRVEPTAPLGKQTLKIIVVTPGNLILTKQVEVEIVDEP